MTPHTIAIAPIKARSMRSESLLEVSIQSDAKVLAGHPPPPFSAQIVVCLWTSEPTDAGAKASARWL